MTPTPSSSHDLQNGRIEIIRVVDPGLYWIRCSECIPPKTIHNSLKSILSCSNYDSQNFQPKEGDNVFITDIDGMLKRGQIMSVKSPSLYFIGLIDYRIIISVHHSCIYPSTSVWNDIDEQAHIIGLSDLVPFNAENINSIEIKKWSLFNEQVSEIVQQYDRFYFKRTCYINNLPFGKVKAVNRGKHPTIYSLKKLLVVAGIGVSTEKFTSDLIGSKVVQEDEFNLLAESFKEKVQPAKRPPEIKVTQEHEANLRALTNGFVLDPLNVNANIKPIKLHHFYSYCRKESKNINQSKDLKCRFPQEKKLEVNFFRNHSKNLEKPITNTNNSNTAVVESCCDRFYRSPAVTEDVTPVGPKTFPAIRGLGRGMFLNSQREIGPKCLILPEQKSIGRGAFLRKLTCLQTYNENS